jgi:hypothetical protein
MNNGVLCGFVYYGAVGNDYGVIDGWLDTLDRIASPRIAGLHMGSTAA